MSELQRAARGASVTVGAPAGGVPPHIMGMSTSVGAAIKRVHQNGPTVGQNYIRTSLAMWLSRSGSTNPGHRGAATTAAHYVDAVDVCANWHTASGQDLVRWQLTGPVVFSPTDAVETVVRAVVEDGSTGHLTGRVIIWDNLQVTRAAAEIMAAPAIHLMDATYPGRTITGIEVWQCFCRPVAQHSVPASAARAAFTRAAGFVASM